MVWWLEYVVGNCCTGIFCFLLQPPSLYTVKAIAILDNDGRRILANYYDKKLFPSIKEEKAYEKNLFQKTHKANADVIMLDGLTCLYRSNVDLFFYVMGDCHENEVRNKRTHFVILEDFLMRSQGIMTRN